MRFGLRPRRIAHPFQIDIGQNRQSKALKCDAMDNATVQPLDGRASPASAVPLRVQLDDLVGLPFFEGVERGVIEALAPAFAAHQFRAGTVLMKQGERLAKLQIVNRGIVELTRMDGEHEFGVLLLSARDLIMPAAAVFNERWLVSVRALTTVRILEIDVNAVRAALTRSPRLSVNLMKAVSGQWRMAVRNILDLNCRTAAQRLGAFLLRLADLQEDGNAAVLPIRKRYLASRLGITPETLSRTLQIVADHGLHLRGRAIIVRDRTQIEEFCGPDPYPDRDERLLNVYAL